MVKRLIYAGIFILMVGSCDNSANKASNKWTLMTLEPGHFHASLIQKSMSDAIDSNCYVFASSDSVAKPHLDLIAGYNNRLDDPTSWNPNVYIGHDFLAKMLQDKPGNIVVLAGNNKLKSAYIAQSAAAGINVLADKPMAINDAGFKQLKESFDRAEKENVLIYDIMTERYDIYAILQKELIHEKSIFGDLKPGTLEDPTIVKKSLHHFYKEVSGKPLIRPTWYYDTEQEGEGLVDVTTHAIDLIQWQCFPEQIFDYERDIEIFGATRWPTAIAKDQYTKSTGAVTFPSFLSKDLRNDTLQVFSNGELNYSLKGIHAKVQVEWAFQADNGSGDTHTSEYKGTRSTIAILQDADQDYKPELIIKPVNGNEYTEQELIEIKKGFDRISKKIPGIIFENTENGFIARIPQELKTGHEAHFAHVASKFLSYLDQGHMPEWERSFMLTKYYLTTKALQMAKSTD